MSIGLDEISTLILNSAISLSRVCCGTLIAFFMGVLLAYVRYELPVKIQNHFFVKFCFEAPRFPPPIAWIPFVILFFGIGEIAAVAIVFIGAISPILSGSYEALRSLNVVKLNAARNLGCSGLRLRFKIMFPLILPRVIQGLRAGVSMGWMSVVAAEMVSGQSGVGYLIQFDRLNLSYDLMILDILMIGSIGYLLSSFIDKLEKMLLPYKFL